MVASLFYIGFVPGMPGTYGSIITALAFWVICSGADRIQPALHIGMVCLVTITGVAASAVIEKRTGVEDPSYIIIDEMAGQLITFLFIPATGLNIILGILAFRTFDIWKPFPIRKLEKLGNGFGVMMDDLLAGIYGCAALQIVNLLI